MKSTDKLSEAEKRAFVIMGGRTRHAGQKNEHRRTITVDTLTAEYFDLTGPHATAGERMAQVLTAYAYTKYNTERRSRGLSDDVEP